MNKKIASAAYFVAAACFLIAAITGGNFVFYPLACCMTVLGCTNWPSNGEDK